MKHYQTVFLLLLLFIIPTLSFSQQEKRKVVSLNGQWDIAVTSINGQMPKKYSSRIHVPGLVDMASPMLVKCNKRTDDSLFWYRKSFKIDDATYDIAELNILRARYHTWVYLNGHFVGENPYNFTASTFNIKKYLKKNAENELVLKIGCFNNVPDSIIDGTDAEIFYYMPGIYDDVFINLSNYPLITNLQTAPDIDKEQLRVVARIKIKNNEAPRQLSYQVKELKTNRIIAGGTLRDIAASTNGDEWKVDFVINMKGATLWSPENPFLYDLSVFTEGDIKSTRVGMRTFRFDIPTGMGILNNQPYYMRGTNVDLNRFFEDTVRKSLPWNKKWVTKLYEGFKGNYWNALRNTTFFPPEFWYNICDSIGILVFDEYDIWEMVAKPELMTQTADQIAREYSIWMRERWNHPSVIVWDAQNETLSQRTAPRYPESPLGQWICDSCIRW
jgi:beta-galactosidase